MLLQMCTEDVYRKNAFHILGLPTNATLKQIRHRQEDLEAAKSLGKKNWYQEFRHWLGAEIPSESNVDEAFESLKDPTQRIVSEFFWVWPDESDESVASDFLCGRRNEAIAKWCSASDAFGVKRLIAKHNLAVVYQALAIEGERQVLEGKEISKSEIDDYWQKSFVHWEELAADDDFWSFYEQRMREFDDPRLTCGFIRRIRHELPIAFDNINARLALRYAKQENAFDAQRHVQYMKRTMCGFDDIELSFESLFEPLAKKIEHVIRGCDELLLKDQANGAKCIEQLLEASKEVVNAVNYLLDANNPLRCRILEDIFHACNGYLVSFGNRTKKWNECLALNNRLRPLACTEELCKRVEENNKILENNVEQAEVENTCFSCGNHGGVKRLLGGVVTIRMIPVTLCGKVQRNYESFGSVKYVKREIEVPCCDRCKVFVNKIFANEKLYKYPPIAKAIQDGYVIGKTPTEAQMRQTWGLPARKGPLLQRSVWNLQKP